MAINQQWWDGLDEEWKGIFRKNTGVSEKDSDFFQKIENLTGLEFHHAILTVAGGFTRIDWHEINISNLEPLRELKNLTKLHFEGFYEIEDFEPISELKNLTELQCDNTGVSDLSPLRELKNLKTFSCRGTEVSDLSPLQELKNLTTLNCAKTKVSDLSPLRELKNLARLLCYKTEVSDLEPLRELKNLTRLFCFNTKISNDEIQALKQALPDCKIKKYPVPGLS